MIILNNQTSNTIITITYYVDIIYILSLVLECRNLPPMDSNGLADPYVNLQLICEEGNDVECLKQKSERKTKTLDPVFNEPFFL